MDDQRTEKILHERIPLFDEEGYADWCRAMQRKGVKKDTVDQAVKVFFYGLAFPRKTFSEIYTILFDGGNDEQG